MLPRLYDSIKRQTFKDFVWVVIYGDSSDNTPEILEDLKQRKEIDIQIAKRPNFHPPSNT